jgi:hypothetical protein
MLAVSAMIAVFLQQKFRSKVLEAGCWLLYARRKR